MNKKRHADLLAAYGLRITKVLFLYSKFLTLQTKMWQGNTIIYIFLVETINAKIETM